MMTQRRSTDIPDEWVMSKIDHSSEDPNFGFVETFYQTCSSALVSLWKSHLRLSTHDPQKSTLKNDVAGIQFWDENFPAGHLDTILAESSGLKIRVLENLMGIARILIPCFTDYYEAIFSTQNECSRKFNFANDLETQLEKAALMLDAEERSESSSEEETSDDSSPTTERHQNRLGRLHSYISCLIGLTPAVERYICSLQCKEDVQYVPIETVFHLSHGAQPYAMRIRDRFENAPICLVERLAEANLERSIRLRMQEDKGEEVEDHTNQDDMTFFKPFSLFRDSGLGTSIPTISYNAATIASHTSFLSVAGEEALGRPRVPPLPQEGGHPFQCSYCHRIISMRNRIEWKMHVIADLESYICTHEDCRDALETFPTRQLWADHEFNEHFTLLRWRCFPCSITFSTPELFVEHLAQAHGITLTGHRLTAITSEARETILTPEFEDYKCPLCLQHGWQTKKTYATHVGRHLEEISLACLPRDEDSSDDGLDIDIPSTPGDVDGPTSSNGKSSDRHRRSPSPQHKDPSIPPPGPKLIEWDYSIGQGNIKLLSRTLFVDGVTCSEAHLRSLFGRFGVVQTCIINVDKRNAFIKMISRSDAVNARDGMESYRQAEMQLRTHWGVGFGPRDCSDYKVGISVIPIELLTEADRKWILTAGYGGTGGRPIESCMVVEEPDIEIGAGVSLKAMSRRIVTDTGGKHGLISSLGHGPDQGPPQQRFNDDDAAFEAQYGQWVRPASSPEPSPEPTFADLVSEGQGDSEPGVIIDTGSPKTTSPGDTPSAPFQNPSLSNEHLGGSESVLPNSYWSLAEKRNFKTPLAHFGEEFEGTSSFMKTKAPGMVRNYLNRQLAAGETDFEEALRDAEERKLRGEPQHQLPMSSLAPRQPEPSSQTKPLRIEQQQDQSVELEEERVQSLESQMLTIDEPNQSETKSGTQRQKEDFEQCRLSHEPSRKSSETQHFRSNLSLENLPSIIKQVQFNCKEPGCKGRFKRQEHLKRHMKSHSKEKPHACWVPGCHRAFSRSDSLKAHCTKTHSKRGGRNRYVATLDETSPDYDPDFRGQLTADGRPIYGSKLEDIPDCDLSIDQWDD